MKATVLSSTHYINSNIHPCIHPSIHPPIHTYIHTYIYSYIHIHDNFTTILRWPVPRWVYLLCAQSSWLAMFDNFTICIYIIIRIVALVSRACERQTSANITIGSHLCWYKGDVLLEEQTRENYSRRTPLYIVNCVICVMLDQDCGHRSFQGAYVRRFWMGRVVSAQVGIAFSSVGIAPRWVCRTILQWPALKQIQLMGGYSSCLP